MGGNPGRTGAGRCDGKSLMPMRLKCGIGSTKLAQTDDAAKCVEREEVMQAAVRLAALVILCAMADHRALAQGDPDFFRNKTIKLTITFEPGGSYDLYARLAATHLPKYLDQ